MQYPLDADMAWQRAKQSEGFKSKLQDRRCVSGLCAILESYGRCCGWGVRAGKKERDQLTTNRTYYVDVEKKIQRSFDNTFAACDISELLVKKVNLEGDTTSTCEFKS